MVRIGGVGGDDWGGISGDKRSSEWSDKLKFDLVLVLDGLLDFLYFFFLLFLLYFLLNGNGGGSSDKSGVSRVSRVAVRERADSTYNCKMNLLLRPDLFQCEFYHNSQWCTSWGSSRSGGRTAQQLPDLGPPPQRRRRPPRRQQPKGSIEIESS